MKSQITNHKSQIPALFLMLGIWLLGFSALASAQPPGYHRECGPSGCRLVPDESPHAYTWVKGDRTGEWLCFWHGRQVGGYLVPMHTWRPYDDDTGWNDPCDLPDDIPLPAGESERHRPKPRPRPKPDKPRKVGATDGAVDDEIDGPKPRSIEATAPHAEAAGKPIFGVNRGNVPQREVCRVSGPEGTREVKKAELIQAMSHGKKNPKVTARGDIDGGPDLGALVDQSKMLRVSIEGSEAERAPVLADLKQAPELAPWRDAICVQPYEPDDWALQTSGAPTGGHPGIIIQAPPAEPGGPAQVLWRETSYTGPLALAGALRQVDPNYDPARDPGPAGGGSQDVKPAVLLIGAIVIGGLVVIASKKKQVQK